MSRSVDRVERELTRLGRQAQKLHPSADGASRLERAAYHVLAWVDDNGPMRLSDLAAAFTLDLSTISRQVATLQAAGLLGRETDPSDRRAGLLTVTDEGRDVLRLARRRRRRKLSALIATWPDGDVDTFADLLARFNTAICAYASADPDGAGAAPDGAASGLRPSRPGTDAPGAPADLHDPGSPVARQNKGQL